MTMAGFQSYYLSKWCCEVHGNFTARTKDPVDQKRPVRCPECIPKFEGQVKGMTKLEVPFVTKPNWPKMSKGTNQFDTTFSDKAPIKKQKAHRESIAPVRFLP